MAAHEFAGCPAAVFIAAGSKEGFADVVRPVVNGLTEGHGDGNGLALDVEVNVLQQGDGVVNGVGIAAHGEGAVEAVLTCVNRITVAGNVVAVAGGGDGESAAGIIGAGQDDGGVIGLAVNGVLRGQVDMDVQMIDRIFFLVALAAVAVLVQAADAFLVALLQSADQIFLNGAGVLIFAVLAAGVDDFAVLLAADQVAFILIVVAAKDAAAEIMLMRSVAAVAVAVVLEAAVVAVLMQLALTGSAVVLMGFVALVAMLMGAGLVTFFIVAVLSLGADQFTCSQGGDLEQAERHDQHHQNRQASPADFLHSLLCHYFVLLSSLESEISAAAPP